MLRIGEFSRLSQVTIATLRHYDDIDLFKPSEIDKFTNYRYYTLEQLPDIHRIMALKELGLSLEEIQRLISEQLSSEQIRGMFTLRKTEIERQLREEQKRLTMLQFHLRMIDVKDELPGLNTIVKEIEPFRALTCRISGENPTLVMIAGREIQQALSSHSVKTKEPHMGIVYGDDVNLEDYDYEFAIPVDASQPDQINLTSQGKLVARELPAITAVTHVLNGADQARLLENKVLLQRWALANGYILKSEMRSVHHRGPMHGSPPGEWVTELQVVVEES